MINNGTTPASGPQANASGLTKSLPELALPAALRDIMNAGARVLNDWTPFTKTFVRCCARTYVRRLRKLSVVVASEAATQRRKRSFFAEHSFAGHFCSLLLAYPKGGKKLTLDEAKGLAAQVNLRKPSGEVVHAREHIKPAGGMRITSRFGPLDRARKRVADDLLRVIWGMSPYEYSRKFRGRDAAIRNALQSFNKGGARRFVRTDVKDFYPSIDHEALIKMLPIPHAVTRNTILIPKSQHINLSQAPHHSETMVRAGAPQGSRPSALIASKLIEPLLDGLPAARMAISHGDDILVGVRTDEEAEDVKNALASRAEKHPAGPFKLKMLEVIRLGKPNNYLGYCLRHRKKIFGGGARSSASRSAIHRFKRKIARKLLFVPMANQRALAEMKCRQWVQSFGEWGGGEPAVLLALLELDHGAIHVVRSFRKFVKAEKLKFKSFAEISALFEAEFLPYV